jgi:hypothetical protein
VDNELGGQFESGRDAGFAGFATVELDTGFKQFPPCRPVDRSIHTTATKKRTVGGIDNSIHFKFGNVGGYYFNHISFSLGYFAKTNVAKSVQ